MLIRVIFTDDTFDYLLHTQLARFLEMGKIAKFKRCSGWVTVGVDPIRTDQSGYYGGPERRAGNA
jgi:hypothetical protein